MTNDAIQSISILGNGAMATVCAMLLVVNDHRVSMWGAHSESMDRLKRDRTQDRLLPGASVPDSVRLTSDDADCFTGATLIVSTIPTQHVRSAWKRLKRHVPPGVPIVSASKGIEIATLLRPTQVIADVLSATPLSIGNKADCPSGPTCSWPLAALSGPNIAGEIVRKLPASAVVAAADSSLAGRVQRAFSTPWFRVYSNADIAGVEIAGATKNVIAIAAGILDGLNAGNNAKSALIARGLVEITRLGVAMGATEATFHGLAGLGDLITTCVSPEGRNRSLGEQLGKGRTLAEILASMASVAEGVPTTQAVLKLAERYGIEMPITESVHAILFENKSVNEALHDLMTREPKPEHEG